MQKSMTASRSILMAFVAIALAVVCAFGFAACGDKKNEEEKVTLTNAALSSVTSGSGETAKTYSSTDLTLTMDKTAVNKATYSYAIKGTAKKATDTVVADKVVANHFYVILELSLADADFKAATAQNATIDDANTISLKQEGTPAAAVNKIEYIIDLGDSAAADMSKKIEVVSFKYTPAGENATAKTITWNFDLRNVALQQPANANS